MSRSSVTMITLVLVSLHWCGWADPMAETTASELADGVGNWQIRIDGGGEIYTAYLSLFVSESGQLTGRYENEGRRSNVKSATLKGKTLTVVANTQRFSSPAVATFTADLSADGTMSGEVDFESGSRSRSYEFTAKRISGTTTESEDVETPARATPAEPEPTRGERKPVSVSFRQGVNGYDKVVDLEIWEIAPSKSLLKQGTMTTDGNNGGGESQVLLRFGDVFGAEPGRIPPNVKITSATLTVIAFDPGTTCYIHRMLVPWTPAATWDGLANGVSIDDIEASTVRDGFTFGEINMDKQSVRFDVTATVQKWADGADNYGWVFRNTGSNGWDFYSSDWIETDLHPQLEVTYENR